MSPSPSSRPPARSHLYLLARASALEQAAMADNIDAVHAELCRLHNTLVEHLRSESDTLGRLLEAINELMVRSGGEEPDCSCVPRSLGVTRALARQARLETGLLLDHQRRRTGP